MEEERREKGRSEGTGGGGGGVEWQNDCAWSLVSESLRRVKGRDEKAGETHLILLLR